MIYVRSILGKINRASSRKGSGTGNSLMIGEEGTTLVEVMTVAALTVIVSFSIYLLIDSIGPVQLEVQHRTELQGEARIAINAIATEVRGRKSFINDTTAPYIASMNADHLQFTKTSSGTVTNPTVYYYVEPIAGSSGKYRLKMTVCDSANCDPTVSSDTVRIRVLSDNVVNGNSVTDPIFTYYSRDNTTCANPESDTIMCELTDPGNRPAGTRWVRIHLILDDDPSDNRRRYETADDVAIRNN